MKQKKLSKPYRATWRFGILNHLGDVWTPETFSTENEAAKYLAGYQAANKFMSLGRHRVVPVRVTVSLLRSK